ncbi:MAG: preprotein translocase subunit SecG [Spirochaetaceae bacterium]|jgi:preprotein translocase subunit SecG|nr:preprotein translocase subunit SecG [Spirochaetaceae bacterium]
MTILRIALLVVFIMVALLLVLLVLIQNEEGDSLGGIFAGGSSSAFGSRSGNVLTRTTSILGGLFLILSFGLALVNRSAGGSGVEAAGAAVRQEGAAVNRNWWQEAETPQSPAENQVFQTPSTEPSAAEVLVPETPEIENPAAEATE